MSLGRARSGGFMSLLVSRPRCLIMTSCSNVTNNPFADLCDYCVDKVSSAAAVKLLSPAQDSIWSSDNRFIATLITKAIYKAKPTWDSLAKACMPSNVA